MKTINKVICVYMAAAMIVLSPGTLLAGEIGKDIAR